MKRLKNIFYSLLVALVVCVPAYADNGCENDDNDANSFTNSMHF